VRKNLSKVLTVLALVGTLAWLVTAPSLEAGVAVIVSLSALLTLEFRSARPAKEQSGKADIKNVIHDHDVSSRLLRGEDLPAFHECVRSSSTCNLPPARKSLVQVSGFNYNHFIGPSVVIAVTWPGTVKPVRLFYSRVEVPGEPVNILRKGRSILFHASYEYNVTRKTAPMDDWSASASREPDRAIADLLRIPAGTLAQVLAYKVALPDRRGTCRPLGIVTRDVRKEEQRAFTQYVFEIIYRFDITPGVEDWREFLGEFRVQHGSAVCRLPDSVEPVDFLKKSEDVKVMDYLVLRGLLNDEASISHERGRYTRGFAIM